MKTNTNFIGQIDLLSLLKTRTQEVDGKVSVVIPVEENPSIFAFTTKAGQPKAMLDLIIRETSKNQYGNTHFVKANVGKSNREKFGLTPEQAQGYSPIIGNLRPLETRDSQQAQHQAPAPVADDDDLPPADGSFGGF